MPKVTIVIREAGALKPDYSLDFDLPAIPAEGQYISISRPDTPQPWSEDLIVRHVWWRLLHPETDAISDESKTGKLTELFVECDIAEGPYASDQWLKVVRTARGKGVDVPAFEVARFSVRQADLTP